MTQTEQETRAPAPRAGRRIAGRAAAVVVAFAAATAVSAPSASPATPEGSVTVRVVRAVDASGTYSPLLEPGVPGARVIVTGDDGEQIEDKTPANGILTFTPNRTSGSGKYRVEVYSPRGGLLFPAFASREGVAGGPSRLSSAVEFVDLSAGKNVSMTTGFWNPADYCQKNAPLATACQPAAGSPAAQRTVLSFPYESRGVNKDVTDLSTEGDTGNVFGLAWNRDDKRLFSSAQAKRSTDYGPGGPGAIYVTDPATKTTRLWATVPDAGTTAHTGGDDAGFLGAVGKESLGGLKLSQDGRDLWVVNLHNRKLYRYDATLPTADQPKAVYAIPTPDCPSADDWRPFGLGMQDDFGYVGGVCTGQSTQKISDLRAVVFPFNPANGMFGGPALNQRLDHRGTPATTCAGYYWYPWQDVEPGPNGTACSSNPEPELGEIGFETDGSMLLSFRDRYADQAAAAPAAGAPADFVYVLSSGDLNKACKPNILDDLYVMDVDLGCGITTRGKGFFDLNRPAPVGHPYATFAGMALSKVESSIATSGYDVSNNIVTAGTMFTLRDGGIDPGFGNELSDGRSRFGKGAAMGDLEVLCDRAPLQIGNRVWYDPERSGVQLPQQKPVPGATVNLYDADGKKVGTTKTTDRGEYYFDDSDVTGGLQPHTAYTIRLDNPADYAEGGPLYHWIPTEPGVGPDGQLDSDGTVPKGGTYVEKAVTTGAAGENDHTFDFGFMQQQGELRLVKHDQDGKPLPGAVFQLWRDTNKTDGLQTDGDKADTKVGEPCTTGEDGTCHTVTDKGTYYWQEVTPPKGYQAPEQPVLGPVVLDDEHLADGITTTAVNQLIPSPPTTPAPTPTPTPAPTRAPSQPSGSLAFTGTDNTVLTYTVVGGAVLLAAGAGLLIAARRRRTH
ncbi:SdrD B-like domain-containing protein [Kitasatospora sp. NPDC092948]|uniref:SdrD B-like domain-containing protein n=1 Tax=Kitasatospora sp. NPDC092948 TaxID=3364088 RepID=UPI0037F69B8A